MVSSKILSSTTVTQPNQRIRMISEGSCDAETGVMMLRIQICHH